MGLAMVDVLGAIKGLVGAKTDGFKTPKQLGVSEEQFCAIMKAAEALQSGKLEQTPVGVPTLPGLTFDMSHWKCRHECGTVCCIGGSAEILSGLTYGSLNKIADRNPGLKSLFFPREVLSWGSITPEMAAKAVINWAKTGNPQWKKVMKS